MTNRTCRQGGVSLIEVLVSVLIFSIGILGLAGMQLNALKFNQTAETRSHAVFLAYEMADRMRASRGDALDNRYVISSTSTLACDLSGDTSGCTIAQMDLAEWKANLAQQLPEGNGSIARAGDLFTITVQWSESRTGGEAVEQFSFTTQL